MSSVSRTADCWFLTGPTASGKTALGIELARRLSGEIVSLDSMAIYRGLNIGTAKPTPDQRTTIPHHLIDIVEPDEEYSVAQYIAAAEQAAGEITARGRQVLFVGGTPLYLKTLLRGMFVGPPADWSLRDGLMELARTSGTEALHERLTEVDPTAAARLHPRDTRRLIRALEVFEKTGLPISQWQAQFERARPATDCRVFVLDWPREALIGRIDARVEAMFAAGLVDEVRGLQSAGQVLSRTASQAVGYREVLDYLAGHRDLAATVELIKTRTRQFAKRQLTWFRSLSECRWVSASEPLAIDRLALEIAGSGASSAPPGAR